MSTEEHQKTFVELYNKYVDELFRYCALKTGNREASLEIVQDVFMRIWQKIEAGGDFDNSRAFLYASTRNSIIDWYRKKKPVSLDELSEAGFDRGFDPRPATHRKIEFDMILKKVEELDEAHREVIILRFVNDLSVTEIAELLGEKENNISVRIHRALEKLKKKYLHEQK